MFVVAAGRVLAVKVSAWGRPAFSRGLYLFGGYYCKKLRRLQFFIVESEPVCERISALFLQHDKRNNRQSVNMYKNKMTGEFKGEAMITYDDPQAAKAAIEWFNG